MAARPAPRDAGFTLIEILIVIGLIGLMAGVLIPNLFSSRDRQNVAVTKARIAELMVMIDGYKGVWGDVPPDDYSLLGGESGGQAKWQFGTDNGKNTGIESLVMHLSMQAKGGGRLDAHEEWLSNTDNDKAPALIELLQTRERKEILDAWDTPFAYFTGSIGSGYGKAQKIVPRGPDGDALDEVEAKPWQNADGRPINPRGFQLISAGPDRVFGNEDDVANFEIPRK
ncbi:MAG: type II secretion system protein [Planctomycetota bacterium]